MFDSSLPADAKTAYLEDPAAVAATLAAYAATGQQVGGITLQPTAVVIAGPVATVTYDIQFAGNPAYQGQTGALTQAGDSWVVTTEQFCSFMALARTPCST